MATHWRIAAGVTILGWWTSFALAGGALVQVKDPAGRGVAEAVVVLEGSPEAMAAAASATPKAAKSTVDQRNLRFVPEISVVRAGTAIDFPNNDQVLHQVYSFSAAKTFKLSLYVGHVHPPLLFDNAGVVTLGCNIHDAMLGFIFVADSPWFGKTDTRGELELQHLPAGNYRVVIWHPRFNEPKQQIEATLSVPAEGIATLTQTLQRPMKPAPSDNSARLWKGY